jgi:uncharacterized RDD family membrane protein YckC
MSAPSVTHVGDPKSVITPEALHVAPELLGLPLARPWRRGAAMAIDGVLVSILSNAPGILLGLAAGLVLLRASTRAGSPAGYVSRFFRLGVRLAGAIVLFVVVAKGFSAATHGIGARVASAVESADDDTPEPPAKDVSATLTGMGALKTAGGVLAFREAKDEAQARRSARAMISAMRAQGLEDDDIEATLDGLASGAEDRPWLRTAAAAEMTRARKERPAAPSADSLALRYAAAVQAGQGDSASALRPRLASALSGEEISRLGADKRRLQSENGELKQRVEELRSRADRPDVVSFLKSFVKDEFGLGLGWVGLYFVATVALFKGRTPGKKAMGIRIVRLNGRPIGWWAAFERFGGYAAGFATGLLGFAQVFWDENRQGIHDKIAETAVIRG